MTIDKGAFQARPLLEVVGVRKSFGGATALAGVDLTIAAGSRHAIVGENGAGKSTLMRIVAGLLYPDDGEVLLDGVPLTFTPAAARAAGVALVHQELSLVPTLSVAENVCLGSQPTRAGFVRTRERKRRVEAVFERLHVALDVNELVSDLPLATRQYVEIAKALLQNPRLLMLDEPTAPLMPVEAEALFAVLDRLVGQGMTVVFISHRIPEILSFCSTITVLRDGQKVADLATANSNADDVIELMVGRELAAVDRRLGHGRQAREVVLTLEGISVPPRVNGVSLQVHVGEIVGIAGLVGAGRTELVRAALGLDRRRDGSVAVAVNGRSRPIKRYRQAISNGIAFVPEERRAEGVILGLSIRENAALPSLQRLTPLGIVRRRSVDELAVRVVKRLDIRPPEPTRIVATLSGGNQQKVALGKWLAERPRVLVLDEPTRGVDVGAKADIHRVIRHVADDGTGVLLISSDLPELLTLADRILVMHDGVMTAEIGSDEASEEVVMRHAAGHAS